MYKIERFTTNIPYDISEAKSGTSDRIFAIKTAAVTQEFAIYTQTKQHHKNKVNV